MTRASILIGGMLGLASMLWLDLHPSIAQSTVKSVKNNTSAIYEDDRIKVAIGECTRKQEILTCYAVLTSKNNDRQLKLNGNAIKLVDFEGNDYNPIGLKLANRTSDNNTIETDLVENIPFKASFNFGRLPTNFDRIALLQIPISLSGSPATLKFRNLAIAATDGMPIAIESSKASGNKTAALSTVKTTEPASRCPENTKTFYRATSKSYLLYVCGNNNPTHLIGKAKDGSQGLELRLRYYDRTKFVADSDNTSYTISADRLIVRQDNKVIAQEKIQVLQALSTATIGKEATKSVPKKIEKQSNSNSNRERNSIDRSTSHPKR